MPVWDEKHLRAATHAAGVALWSWNVDTDAITLDERAYELWGISKDQRKVNIILLISRESDRHSLPRAQ
jgi:PAS domain-containing protein